MALTHKNKLFIKHYIHTQNGADSVRKAGYKHCRPDVYASQLLSKPLIKDSIEKELKAIRKELDISNQDILDGLSEISKNKDNKNSDRIQSYKLLASIKGMTKDTTNNIAIFSNSDIIDKEKQLFNKRISNKL